MRKLFLIIPLLAFYSCSKTGGIQHEPKDFVVIHGKTYKLMSITPCENCRAIWIMYPKDSTDNMPQSINYEVMESKNTRRTETIIKVD